MDFVYVVIEHDQKTNIYKIMGIDSSLDDALIRIQDRSGYNRFEMIDTFRWQQVFDDQTYTVEGLPVSQ